MFGCPLEFEVKSSFSRNHTESQFTSSYPYQRRLRRNGSPLCGQNMMIGNAGRVNTFRSIKVIYWSAWFYQRVFENQPVKLSFCVEIVLMVLSKTSTSGNSVANGLIRVKNNCMNLTTFLWTTPCIIQKNCGVLKCRTEKYNINYILLSAPQTCYPTRPYFHLEMDNLFFRTQKTLVFWLIKMSTSAAWECAVRWSSFVFESSTR